MNNKDRFFLCRCARGGEDCDYEVSNDDPVLYRGNDFEELKRIISENS